MLPIYTPTTQVSLLCPLWLLTHMYCTHVWTHIEVCLGDMRITSVTSALWKKRAAALTSRLIPPPLARGGAGILGLPVCPVQTCTPTPTSHPHPPFLTAAGKWASPRGPSRLAKASSPLLTYSSLSVVPHSQTPNSEWGHHSDFNVSVRNNHVITTLFKLKKKKWVHVGTPSFWYGPTCSAGQAFACGPHVIKRSDPDREARLNLRGLRTHPWGMGGGTPGRKWLGLSCHQIEA